MASQPAIQDQSELLVPTLCLFEVYRHVLRHLNREEALGVVGAMHRGTVVELDNSIALDAAELSVATRLPLADSIILATARTHGVTLWTQDVDFQGHEAVSLHPKS